MEKIKEIIRSEMDRITPINHNSQKAMFINPEIEATLRNIALLKVLDILIDTLQQVAKELTLHR